MTIDLLAPYFHTFPLSFSFGQPQQKEEKREIVVIALSEEGDEEKGTTILAASARMKESERYFSPFVGCTPSSCIASFIPPAHSPLASSTENSTSVFPPSPSLLSTCSCQGCKGIFPPLAAFFFRNFRLSSPRICFPGVVSSIPSPLSISKIHFLHTGRERKEKIRGGSVSRHKKKKNPLTAPGEERKKRPFLLQLASSTGRRGKSFSIILQSSSPSPFSYVSARHKKEERKDTQARVGSARQTRIVSFSHCNEKVHLIASLRGIN